MKEESEDSVSNLELLNHVIALQLKTIEEYNNKHPNNLSSKSQEAMNNLIKLLELREKYNAVNY